MSGNRGYPTALHEAAHAVASYRLCLPLGVVSVRPTASYGGICTSGGVDRGHEIDIAEPLLILQPARPRRWVEAVIRRSLAGPAADWMFVPKSGFRRTPKVVDLKSLPALSPRAAAELTEVEALGNGTESPFIHDEDLVLSYSAVLVGESLAPAYLRWAMADTDQLVARNASTIERLADELIDRQAMAPHEVRAVLSSRP